jgi:hypothetical protein
MTTRKQPAKRKVQKDSNRKSSSDKKVKLWAMHSTPAIHIGDDVYPVNPDRSIDVPADLEDTFLIIGCTREPPQT